MDKIQDTFAKRDSEGMKEFGYKLYNQFTKNEADRRQKEVEWTESLRQIKGIYDPDVVIEEGNSKVYPKITRSKINIVLSRLHEMLFPENDRNWEINPTPEPSIGEDLITQIAMSLVQEDPETGQLIPPTADQLDIAVKKFAQDTSDKMMNVMDDQFTEMDYPEETKKVLRSGLNFGTGILKGPMIEERRHTRWIPSQMGYEQEVTIEEVPFYEAIRVWDWYPDMSVVDIDKIEGSFERHVMTRHDLRQLMKRDDFFTEEIKAFMEEHPTGNYTAKTWENDLQTIDLQATAGTSQNTVSSSTWDSDRSSTDKLMGKKYEVLEFWGYVDGLDLASCGVNVDDVELEYTANVWLLGKIPIKAVLYNGALDRYKVFYYEKDETSIFGEGLARVMRHSQISLSAATRMLLDNSACVSGDTEVYRNQRLGSNRKAILTVRELWESKSSYKSGLRRSKIRCLNEETGELFFNKIIDVFNNGIKPVYEVRTAHGYSIKATEDHRFICETGDWQEMSCFSIGDVIAVNGTNVKPLGKCIECGSPTSTIGVRCRSCASKKENSSWNARQIEMSRNNHNASEGTARQRWLCQKDKKDYCERCGVGSDTGTRLCIHHKDGNPYNNEVDNKMTLCQPCHMAVHHRYDYYGKPFQHQYIDFDEIIDITYIGEEEVFDIQVESPNHNYVANGFVVHNCVAGPQLEVNMSLLSPDTDINSIYARKIWFREGRGIEAQYPALRSVEFNSHLDELLRIIDAFKQFGDEETTLPTWMIGQTTNNETAQATSGRMATITISIKDVVKNFDAFTEKVIKDLYAWNMEFNPRTDIKGDFVCKPRGVSSLVMKEIRMQALTQFSTTLTDEEKLYLDTRDFLKEKAKAHDLNIRIKTDEEVAQIKEAQRQSEESLMSREMMRGEIFYKFSQALAQLAKARDKNVDALMRSQGEDTRKEDQEIATMETDRAIKENQELRDQDIHIADLLERFVGGQNEREETGKQRESESNK